ncbi:Uncharacterized protein family Cys-rich [Macleaya cordata]|uniref:Uncharacterized protein family Cys-rich n=1 Tax=Macleaya cordata TaxID=56857 RepID=A0A200RC72_MACCD|nr:Uncharacterized protein family Cys-rich [Macleaya cordata]
MGRNQTTDVETAGGKQGSGLEVQGGGGGTVVAPYFPVAEPTVGKVESYGGNEVVYGTPIDATTTTDIHGIPKVQMVQNTVEIPWSTGLFSCHQHWKNALVTVFLPCVTFGQIAEIVDEGETSSAMAGFLCCLTLNMPWFGKMKGCKYRKKLREKYNLEKPIGDSVSHIFCPCCALCQEFRELKNRGLDPSLGWKASLAAQQQNQEKFTIPPKNQNMFKY